MNVREQISHEQAIELLPWLVNDSLEDLEKEAVLEHAHACVICRRELSSLQQLQDTISQASIAWPVPAPDMRKINARIDALIDRQNSWRDLLKRFRNLFDRPWRIAFAAQSVVLIALAAVLMWPEPDSGQFTTLTETETLPEGRYVRVVFSPDLQQSQLALLLDELKLTIVEGPSNRGVYTLAVASSAKNTDLIVSSLQGDPDVLFAQPVTIGADR